MIVVGRLIKVKISNTTSKNMDSSIVDDPNFYFDRKNVTIAPFFDRFPIGFRNSTRAPPFFRFDDTEDDRYQNSTEELPPERLTADYIEMGILIVMVLIGGPLNFVSLFRSLRSDPPFGVASFFRLIDRFYAPIDRNGPKSIRQSFDLKIHLTVANLLVIWVYALSDLCWLATYSWNGGDFMCRFVRFTHAFCFYATSNLVTTIAIQRLSVAMKLDRPMARRPSSAGQSRVYRNQPADSKAKLAYGAWTLAFLCSIPQLIIWRTFELYPGWEQCVTTWTIERYLQQKEENRDGSEEPTIDDRVEYEEKIYNGLHLAFVFWLPVLIIIVCYVLIVTRFHRKIKKQALQIAADATAEAESRAASVRASLVFGGPVADAGSPLLLPIAVCRALQYQSIESSNTTSSEGVSSPRQRRTVPLRRQKQRQLLCCPCFNRINRYRRRSNSRVDALQTDEELDQPGSATILNATLIGGARRPYMARKSFAISTLSRAKKKTMKKTIWILLAYLICWSPYNMLILWRCVDPNVDLYDFEMMYNLIVLNAVINPLLYGI